MKGIKLYMIICCLAMISLVSSCTKTTETETPDNDKIALNVPISKGGGNVDEDITNARIIIFKGQGGGELIVNNYKTGTNISFRELVPVGTLDVYLVANERPEWNLGSITTKDDLRTKILSFSAHPVVNATNLIPMVGIYEQLRINADGSLQHKGSSLSLTSGGTVERLYAKATLDLSCFYKDLPGNNPTITNTIELESVSVKRMARKSWMIPAIYRTSSDADLFDGAEASLAGVIYDHTNADLNKRGFHGQFAFYIPEYIISDLTKHCYISIVARIKENPSVKLRYKIVIGDGISSKTNAQMNGSGVTLNDLKVTRNTHYEYVITTINGFGEIEGLEIFHAAKPWEPSNVPVDIIQRKLNVSSIERNIKEAETVRINFWSNQPNVYIEPDGYLGATGTTTFDVNTFFNDIAGGVSAQNFHYTYNGITKTGSGYFDITTLSNTSGDYVHRIILNANGLKREIKLNTSLAAINDWSVSPWVGTFHRGDQTGERIIYSGHTGDWSAEVEDPSGDGDFVVLSRTSTKDKDYLTPATGNAEYYAVTDGVKTISGKGRIYFRMGLTSTSSTQRYARIKVNWKSSGINKVSYIYVRQGENFTDIAGQSLKWSVYNLSDPQRGTGGANNSDHNAITPLLKPYVPKSFTEYPSQAGYLFQWNRSVAYHPINPTAAINSYPTTSESAWSTSRDACPYGFRQATATELYSSTGLLGGTSTAAQAGYYSDGYFDRRSIVDATGTNSGTKSVVNPNSPESAFAGILIYNKSTSASLFLPAVGVRTTTGLNYSGATGYYWSKTPLSGSNSQMLNLNKSTINLSSTSRTSSGSVRCIRENFPV